MVFVGNGYYPFRNAGTAFPWAAPPMVFVGAARCGRPWQSSSAEKFPSLRGPTLFACPKRVGRKTTPGEAFRHCSRNDMHPPPAPLPRYSLLLHRWVALPAQNWLRQFGRMISAPTTAPSRAFPRTALSMMVVGNGYHPFRNAGMAFPRTAPPMAFVGAARCGRPWQSSSAEKFPMLCRHHRWFL